MEKTFKTLLILDALRGTDSTGAASVVRNGDVLLAKQVGNPYELFETNQWGKLMQRFSRALLGHNRYATQGKVNKNNAHPFEFETLIGAHNGTLHNKHELLDHQYFDVDSMNLYHHIDKKGVKDAIKVSRGAWSLTYWDKVEETINFLRNDQRPMYMTYTADKQSIIWASEGWMIDVACGKNNVKIEEIFETEVDMHYSFHVPSNVVDNVYIEKPILCPVKGAADPAVVIPQQWGGQRSNGFQGQQQTQQTQKQEDKKVVSFTKAPTRTVQATEPTNSSGSNSSLYAGTKRVVLDVLSEARDSNGSRYAVCFDPNRPQAGIRLYLKKEDKVDALVDKAIVGDIGLYHMEGGKSGYYKVDYATFRLAKPARDEGKYLGASGNMLSRDDWEQAHGECCWCTSSIFAQDAHKFVKSGGTLCSDCMNDSEVSQYIN